MGNSTVAGFLQPDVSSPPLEGKALYEFLQQWMVGLTGLDGTLVRPRWQSEPPTIPDKKTAWVAIGITSTLGDAFPYVEHDGAVDGSDTIRRNQNLELLCSFYDDGVAGLADQYGQLASDNCAIQQNRDYLLGAGILLRAVPQEGIVVPSLFKTNWLYRVDWRYELARQIDRRYSVFSITSMQGTLYEDTGLPPVSIDVEKST